MVKEIFALSVILIDVVNTVVYMRAILKKKTKPHAFSWIVWALTEGIAGAAQFADGAGVGSLPLFFTALSCLLITLLALFHHGERNITRSDWAAFGGALAAIPLWMITENPLWAAVLITFIDGIAGIYPTYRKSWANPHEENLFMFASSMIGYSLVVLALENYTVTTILFPASIVLSHGVLVIMLLWRRRTIRGRAHV